VPGVHFLWFGIAAIIVGLLGLGLDLSWQWQVIAFGVLSVLTVFWVRRYVRPDVAVSDLPDLNERGQQYVGRSLVVEQAIQNGRGKVRVGDTLWQAEGPDTPAGSRVRVTATRGTVLVVERAPA
jgi:membrane protein implicated in regulation of membrane protease activity